MRRGTRFASWAIALGIVASAGCVAPVPVETAVARTPVAGDSPLVRAFAKASAETGVPAELLATLSYVSTRLRHVDGAHAHGQTRLGMFGLSPDDVARGAMLAGLPDDLVRRDADASIRAGAALLREAAPAAASLEEFVATLRPELRDAVVDTLARGVDARDTEGKRLVIAARDLTLPGLGEVQQAVTLENGYPGSEWIPAYAGNYGNADRGVGDINAIVIHNTEGSYASAVSWFKDPDAGVSAHYLLRSRDGHVAQMVDERDVAWHDRCFNTKSIGIEHEGFMADPDRWYTEAMYVESAKVTAYLADKYGIAKTHSPTTITGHGEAPDCSDHTDPGPGWNWDHYMDLVRTGGAPQFDAGDVAVAIPASITSGERVSVTVTVVNRGNTTWNLDETRLGTALPHDRDSMLFVDGDWLAPNRATATDGIVEPTGTGTFTFDIVAPDVSEPLAIDEAFQLVQEGVTWFGPEIHLVTQIMPRRLGAPIDPADDSGGCSATGGAGSSGAACAMLALGAVLARRRRRGAPRRGL